MSGEARRAHKRIDVNRPVELAELDEHGAVVGYTRNLSEDGVAGRFDIAPALKANVLVRLFLEEGADPIEKRGRVVWCAPDIYGDGTEVGLRLVEDEDADRSEPEPLRTPVLPEQVLGVGQRVQVSRCGVAYDAVVAEIGAPDENGKIAVLLSTAAEISAEEPAQLAVPQTDDPALDAEQWKPHPFRDAWAAIRRYGGPPARVLAAAAVVVGAVLAQLSGVLWSKLPAQARASVESFFRRASRSLARMRSALTGAGKRLTSRAARAEEE